MASASEVECAALFINSMKSIVVSTTLEEMVHTQPATPMQVDSNSDGIMIFKIQQKRSKSMDIHFYWLINIVKQKHFEVFCKPGLRYLGDYFTKHHSPAYHKGMRPIYLYCLNIGEASARVC